MESRSRASPEQFVALLEFMESHGDLTRPQQGPQGRIKADRLWQELGELLNSLGGGVIKPVDKWKKVWADWKAKTKKKALRIRSDASGTGGGPSSRQTLTAAEERVLGLMGLTAVVGQAGIEERGFGAPPSERNSIEPPARDSAPTVCLSQISATDEIMVEFIPSNFLQATPVSPARTSLPPTPSGELRTPHHPPPPVPTPPPGTVSAPMPSATSPTASTSRVPLQRRQHRACPSPAASPTTSTPRRRRLLRARTRRIQTPFEQATSEFVAVEHRRLQFEEDREKNLHIREMERLRLESRRIEIIDKQNQILSRLAGTVDNLVEILPQLRQSSLPSTDIIP